jgi:tetratricopeptide (TPR) repeat protein
MRSIILIVVFAMFSSLVFAQNEDVSKESGMMNVSERTFQGTENTIGINEFIQENLYYLPLAHKWGTEGTVVVQFKILPTGNLAEFVVINSVTPECDKAVISVLEATQGMWNPGISNGNPVEMEKEVAVVFKVERTEMYKTAQSYVVKADKAMKKGDYNRAIKLYNKAFVFCPNYPSKIYQRGLASYYSGHQQGALKDFKRSARLGFQLADIMLDKLREEAVYASKAGE